MDTVIPRDNGSVSSLNVACGNARGSSAHEDICKSTFRCPLGEARKLLDRIEKTTRKRGSWLDPQDIKQKTEVPKPALGSRSLQRKGYY